MNDISYSDDSHLFGFPITVKPSYEGIISIPIKRSELRAWIEKTEFLQKAGFNIQFQYAE